MTFPRVIDLGYGIGVMPEGGREFILRPENSENVFWENPNFSSHAQWFNPGGGRTWISPEAELYFPHMAVNGRDDHSVPPEIDPGHYEILEQRTGHISLQNRIGLHFWNGKGDLPLILEKRIDALEQSPVDLPEGISFAGYRLKTVLRAEHAPRPDQRPAVWNILQVPPDGEIRLKAGQEFNYFGRSSHTRNGEKITLSVPAKGEPYKLGFTPPPRQTMRFFYWNGQRGTPYFIVREFTAASRCADIPFPDLPPDAKACPVQFFCDNGAIGGFGEMEYHADYLKPEEPEVADECLTYAFAGNRDVLSVLFERFS